MRKRSKRFWLVPNWRADREDPFAEVCLYREKPKLLMVNGDYFRWQCRSYFHEVCWSELTKLLGTPPESWKTDKPEPVAVRLVLDE